MCFAWISEQTTIISLYKIKLSAFITDADVYCAVRTWSLNQTYTFFLKGLMDICTLKLPLTRNLDVNVRVILS